MLDSYDQDRPQLSFKKHIRNNHIGSTDDLHRPEHSQQMKDLIPNLDIDNMLWLPPTYQLKQFEQDAYEYIEEEVQLKKMIQDILDNERIIGIDIEQTNTNTYQGYNCLIQISTTKKDYLIDAIALHDVLPDYLRDIFENPGIVKVFYSGISDLLWLKRDYGIFLVNYFDVFYAASAIEKSTDASLVGLLNKYCGENIEKNIKKQLQVSDWRKRPLSTEQLNYAALDSHYLIYLRNKLLEKLIETKDKPEVISFLKNLQKYCLKPYELKSFSVEAYASLFDQEWNAFRKSVKKNENKSIQKVLEMPTNQLKNIFLSLSALVDKIARDVDTDIESVCAKKTLFDIAISDCNSLSQLGENLRPTNLSAHLLDNALEIEKILKGEDLMNYIEKLTNSNQIKESAKLQRQQEIEKKRKVKEIYENCKILSLEGEVLSYTHREKMNWYLQKGLATLVQEQPPIIQLNFKPSGKRPEVLEVTGGSYENSKPGRMNRCTVCGQTERLSRYHIIPLNYRQHFPEEMKLHRAIDVILLCGRCLEKANKEANKFKGEIAKKYGVPLVEFKDSHQLKVAYRTIKKVVTSYKKHNEMIPEENQGKMKQEIKSAFVKIKDDENLAENIKKDFEKLQYENDGSILVNQEFIEFFHGIKDFGDFVSSNPNSNNKNIHGKLVLEKLKTKEDIKDFINEWRTHFVSALDPQFLPEDLKIILSHKAGQQKISQDMHNESK